ncbi:MAG: HypC/HybG/HupF family hydrogenase formation chaperone [Desulfatitalea sp.]|nr:HypC/HybG/HupF family hydrogenase formation chaperone [Desulfatitalea sp.]NNK02039.1 HypC/HybG/HupF family hydrogenase formation chaperone [Desulfatitalea sp.]
MCLAVPSRIIAIDGQNATIDTNGVKRRISLMLLADTGIGDYVIVHAGFAISRLDEASARETLALLAQAINPMPQEP